jgi:cysteine desulfurase
VQQKNFLPINCDANATFGVSSVLVRELVNDAGSWGNPSSIHQSGQRARGVVEEAREVVGAVVGAGPRDNVVWTSGATEANNLIIRGFARLARKSVILTSPFEHPSVFEVARQVGEQSGWSCRLLPTRGHELDLDSLAEIAEGAGVISVMLANNETGYIYPIAELVQAVRRIAPGVLIHVDAVQGVGRIPVKMAEWGVDAVTLSGHKLGAFPGVGAAIIRAGIVIDGELLGGNQESGMRAGTQPVPAIHSLHRALLRFEEMGGVRGRAARMASNRAAFLEGLGEEVGVLTVPSTLPTVPNTASIRIPGVSADYLVVAADLHGVLISSGSACSSGTQRPSPVLIAAGLSEQEARETIRVSVTDSPEIEDFWRAGQIVAECAGRLCRVVKSARAEKSPFEEHQ